MALVLLSALCRAAEVEVTAIANEGFLVRSADKAVLVDALFQATAPYPEFFQQGPSTELLDRMIAGEAEFSRVDLALVTHHHADHHDAATAVRFLSTHPETVLIGTESVLESMTEVEGYAEIADRVIVPEAAWNSCVAVAVSAISVSVCRVSHSGIPTLSNHVYRVDLDGFRFVHEGDSDLSGRTFRGLELSEDGLHLAFVHSWWVNSDEGRGALLSDLDPAAIVLMHHRWAMAGQAREYVARIPLESRLLLPPVKVFEKEGERMVFESRVTIPD